MMLVMSLLHAEIFAALRCGDQYVGTYPQYKAWRFGAEEGRADGGYGAQTTNALAMLADHLFHGIPIR